MLTFIIKKSLIRLEKLKKFFVIFIVKKKIKKIISSNKINSKKFFKLVLKFILVENLNYEWVAIYNLNKKISNSYIKNNKNPMESLLYNQSMPLPVFFRNDISFFNINKCLGVGVKDIELAYSRTLNNLLKKTNDLNCNHFINLISEKKSFHYLKYTHGFWDYLSVFAIKEYALANNKNFIMNNELVFAKHIYNNNYLDNLSKLVHSEKFIKMVQNKSIYFCPTTSNGSIGSKIEFKIMKDLSKKNFLYHYSQVMLLEEFSKNKEITSSNIFKKIICTDKLRNIFLNELKKYDLILICNFRVASKISKIYPYLKKIYCLPDQSQDKKHHAYAPNFASDVCESIINQNSKKPTLILSQAGPLSSFISFEILTKYKNQKISLIDVGKPLQTLFSPEIIGGGEWRDKDNLKHKFNDMSHLISDDLLHELKIDTKAETKIKEFKKDMDIEDATKYQKINF